MWAFISPWAFGDAVLQMHALKAWQSPNVLAHKWGGGGGPPWGEFNPPATEGVPTACRIHFQLALSNHSWPISTFFRVVHSRNSIWSVLSPILSFPQEPGDHRKPDAKKRKSLVFSHFWSIFSPSEPRLKNDIEKTSKKVRKSRILASQTPPKTKPKSCLFGKRRFLKNRAPA